jgi:hypothetical protein
MQVGGEPITDSRLFRSAVIGSTASCIVGGLPERLNEPAGEQRRTGPGKLGDAGAVRRGMSRLLFAVCALALGGCGASARPAPRVVEHAVVNTSPPPRRATRAPEPARVRAHPSKHEPRCAPERPGCAPAHARRPRPPRMNAKVRPDFRKGRRPHHHAHRDRTHPGRKHHDASCDDPSHRGDRNGESPSDGNRRDRDRHERNPRDASQQP